ncbi:MAG: sulfatase-like hydrolase/transferase [Verrucomicrobia bacterium]|nr:sulfatase-like hydrolase/transferase [Verrucomicrobiota bacterium]
MPLSICCTLARSVGRVVLAFLAVLAGAAETAPLPAKPNVILIYSDDHGYADLAAQKTDPDIRTPHLDALARDGVRFTKGYVSAPQCVPSRAGVITGRYQQRFGVEDNLKGPLPLAEVTIAERLKPAGYVSGQVGKWHLEPTPRSEEQAPAADAHAFLPGAQGFDEYWCGPMNTFMASHDLKGTPLAKPPQRLTDPRFRCVWQTEAALTFINRHAREPFFLYLAYYTPHVPLQSPEPWFSKTPAHLPLERRQALAMIAAMDEGIGQLRARLRELNIEKNTLIFFIGDNGAPLKDGAWNGSLNTPLTGEKGMLTDGGIRTPFVAAWPGVLPAGKIYTHPVINLDVAATAAALAGLPADPALDGVNVVPFVRGEKAGAPHDALFWRWRSQAAVRDARWKLIFLGPTQKFLFDLDSPEGETKNRLAENPGVAAELERRLRAWDATLPAPHLPRAAVAQDDFFFNAHVLKTAPAPVLGRGDPLARKAGKAAKAAKASGGTDLASASGWVGRSCTLVVQDGALRITPDGDTKRGRGFITHTGLNLAGPLRATVRLRTQSAGSLSLAWRTREQADFVSENTARAAVAASADWQTVAFDVPAKGNVIHVRLHPPGDGVVELATVELQPTAAGAAAQRWKF